jgi:hypothetical protein
MVKEGLLQGGDIQRFQIIMNAEGFGKERGGLFSGGIGGFQTKAAELPLRPEHCRVIEPQHPDD